MQYHTSTFEKSVSRWFADVFGRRVALKNSHGWIFFSTVVIHGGVKTARLNWLSSPPRRINQHAVAIKAVTEGADDGNGCI